MNTYILVLKGHNKDLAIAEFETLFETFYSEKIKLENLANIFYRFKTNHKINDETFLTRLTYTNILSEQIYEAKDFDNFKEKAPHLGFEKFDNIPFCVRAKRPNKKVKIPYEEKYLAKPIFDSMKDPKISLENPKETFYFFFFAGTDKIIITRKIMENNKDYLRRMPLRRPVKMPYTLKSDMARCAINLLNLKEGTVLDPFCGIGGILLEASDMNFDVIGNDISYNDLKHFKTNYEFFYPKSNYIRTLADSQSQFLKDNSADGIVTDIPYGRCSRKLGKDLYEKFLINAKKMLRPHSRLVIIYANFCEFKQLALKHFEEVLEVKEYINKSMTRYILVLENKK